MILSEALALYLESKSLGIFGEDIFVGLRPAEPVECFTIYDTGGFIPKKDTTSDPTLEIITRDKSYHIGLEKLKEVNKYLKEKYNFWLLPDFIWVYYIEGQGEPKKIGRDENGYHLFSVNYHLWLKYY